MKPPFPSRNAPFGSLPNGARSFWLRLVVAASVLSLLAAATGRTAPAGPQPIRTAADLWRGYDPETAPLEIETLRNWEEAGIRYRKLTFVGEAAGRTKIRILAIEAAPLSGRRLPGVLHIHGGGQTLSQDWVRFWAQRGYVAVSFDFCGKWPGRTEFTDWGPVAQANMALANGGFQVHPTPRESSWYHWAVASRRALTLLAQHPQVDRQRLGIFGVSVGGTLCWLVAASDARVKTAVPVYGCGYNYDNRNRRWGFPELSSDLELYKRTLSPEAHAPYIRCPLLYLSATNDFHGPMDYAFDSLGAVRAPVRQAFTPRTNHHLDPEQGGDIECWMDWQLRGGPAFPRSPEVRLSLDAKGVPQARVVPDHAGEVSRVDVFSALGDRLPQARYWRSSAVLAGKPWEAALPVMDPHEPLFVFANVTYRSGVCLSSRLVRVVPEQLGAAYATLAWTAELRDGASGFDNWFYTAGYTDPNSRFRYLQVAAEGSGEKYLRLTPEVSHEPTQFTLSTHIVSDPQFRGRPGMLLQFEYRGDYGEQGLTVNAVVNDWRPTSRTYMARLVTTERGPTWHVARLPAERFRDSEGRPLPAWKDVERIELKGSTPRATPPGFRAFHWQPPSE